MFAIAIDCGDQRRQGHAALAGNLLQTVPELVFKADARLVACNDNRALRNQRLHGLFPARTKSKEVLCLTVARINWNLWPEQHSQRRTLRVSLASLSGDFGGNDRWGSRGPLEWSLIQRTLQGLSQNASPSRTSQTDQALTLYIWPSIADFDAPDNAPSSEYLAHH